MAKATTYTLEEKAAAVARLTDETASAIAASMGVSVPTLYYWRRGGPPDAEGAEAPTPRPPPKPKPKPAPVAAMTVKVRITAAGGGKIMTARGHAAEGDVIELPPAKAERFLSIGYARIP